MEKIIVEEGNERLDNYLSHILEMTRSQIKKVSNLMDKGATHDEAVKQVKKLGNSILDKIMTRVGV